MNRILRKFMERQPARFIAIGFLTIILVGAGLLTCPFATRSREATSFVDALLTATSATCVTGLSVVDTGSYWSGWGQLIILILIQVGGLGFMSLAAMVSLMFRRSLGIRERLLLAESINTVGVDGILRMLRYMLFGTFLCEGVGAALLCIRFVPEFGFGKGIFYSIFHSVSAFCNAGFDILGTVEQPFSSLSAYVTDPLVNIVIMLLIVFGGIGFLVWEDVLTQSKPKRWKLHTKLVLSVTGCLLVSGFLGYLILEWNNPLTLGQFAGMQKLWPAAFMSVTTRTAGFSTFDITGMGMPSKVLTMAMMFIGGSPGSTAGGIKTTVFGVAILSLYAVLKGKNYIHIFRRRLNSNMMLRAIAIIVLGICFVCIGTFLIVGLDNRVNFISPATSNVLFETVSGFATVGLSMNLTPLLSPPSLIVLCFLMFVGRVGIFTVLLSFMIKQTQADSSYQYPEERLLIG